MSSSSKPCMTKAEGGAFGLLLGFVLLTVGILLTVFGFSGSTIAALQIAGPIILGLGFFLIVASIIMIICFNYEDSSAVITNTGSSTFQGRPVEQAPNTNTNYNVHYPPANGTVTRMHIIEDTSGNLPDGMTYSLTTQTIRPQAEPVPGISNVPSESPPTYFESQMEHRKRAMVNDMSNNRGKNKKK